MSSCLWEVIGGADTAGILVREGQENSSRHLGERLATGAMVRQLALAGEQLQFELLKGVGPSTGWISVSVRGEPFVVQSNLSEAAIELNWSPATPLVSYDTPKPEKIPQNLIDGNAPFDKKTYQSIVQCAHQNLPGAHFNMKFPHTAEQIQEFGAEWLTKAFHAAGTLPANNAVKEIVKIRGFPGGGAGFKAELVVEYEKPDENLHTDLFVKLPLPVTEKNRHFCINLKQEPSELLFNRYYVKCLPLRAPKYYFGDWNAQTSNWILISEKLTFASKSTRGQRLAPFEFEAPVLKGMDWILSDIAGKYYALWRACALLGAWAHAGKLGSQIESVFAKDPPSFAVSPMPEKKFKPFVQQAKDFILNVAPGFFPGDIANSEFIDKLEAEATEVHKDFSVFNDYLTTKGHGAFGFVHPNLQLDNGFYWVDKQGRTDAGLFDWGFMRFGTFVSILVPNLSTADAEVRVGHLAGMCNTFVKTLAEFGGPQIDAEYFYRHAALVEMKMVCTAMTIVDAGGFGGIYEGTPKEEWKTRKNLNDPEWAVEDVPTMMRRYPVVMLVECVKAWKGGEYYSKFVEWREVFGQKGAVDAAKQTAKL